MPIRWRIDWVLLQLEIPALLGELGAVSRLSCSVPSERCSSGRVGQHLGPRLSTGGCWFLLQNLWSQSTSLSDRSCPQTPREVSKNSAHGSSTKGWAWAVV